MRGLIRYNKIEYARARGGKSDMTEAERAMRRTANRVGGALLFFTGLFWLFQLVLLLVSRLTGDWDPMPAAVLYELSTAAGYATVFVAAALFFRLLCSADHYEPLRARFSLPRHFFVYLFLALSLNLVFAVANSYLVEPFHYSSFMEDVTSTPAANYEIVLAMLTTAVVPAFVEELLFRGVILNNLMPYGRDTAVVLSALTFGLMHQNAGQFLYTTVTGLVLGYVFVVSGNIWAGVLIHFVNNALSVLWDVLADRLPKSVSNPVIYAAETAILLAGVAAFLFLITRRDRPDLSAKEIPELPGTPVATGTRVRLFLTSPTVIVFMVISGFEMIAYLLLAVVWGVAYG